MTKLQKWRPLFGKSIVNIEGNQCLRTPSPIQNHFNCMNQADISTIGAIDLQEVQQNSWAYLCSRTYSETCYLTAFHALENKQHSTSIIPLILRSICTCRISKSPSESIILRSHICVYFFENFQDNISTNLKSKNKKSKRPTRLLSSLLYTPPIKKSTNHLQTPSLFYSSSPRPFTEPEQRHLQREHRQHHRRPCCHRPGHTW